MRLFVKWAPGQDADESPAKIWWENGRLGTLQDYANNYATHQTFIPDTGSGARLILYPEAFADVRFDRRMSKWVYTAPGKLRRVVLAVTDPEATGDQINAAIADQAFIPNPEATKITRRTIKKPRAKGASA